MSDPEFFKPIQQPMESQAEEEIPFAPTELVRLAKRKWILAYARKKGVGAEIGVFRGHFSAVLCEVLQPKRLYLVDPWTKLGETFGWGAHSEYTGFGKLTTAYALNDTRSRVGGFSDIDIRIVEDFSDVFLPQLSEKLDWVYLDASHDYQSTLKELQMIDRVLKPHGVILGDDWEQIRHKKDHGVFRAIHDFIRSHRYEVVAAGPARQWCLRRTPSIYLNIGKMKVAGIRHFALDPFDHPLHPGEPFEVGGVVVLEPGAFSDGSLILIHAQTGSPASPVQWGMPSQGMAKKYPDAGNGSHARFACKGIVIHPGDRLELHLESGGRSELLWSISAEPAS